MGEVGWVGGDNYRKDAEIGKIEQKRMGGFLGRNSRLPLDGAGVGVPLGLAGEQHVGSTHVPVVVVAHYGHLRGVWRERKKTG